LSNARVHARLTTNNSVLEAPQLTIGGHRRRELNRHLIQLQIMVLFTIHFLAPPLPCRFSWFSSNVQSHLLMYTDWTNNIYTKT